MNKLLQLFPEKEHRIQSHDYAVMENSPTSFYFGPVWLLEDGEKKEWIEEDTKEENHLYPSLPDVQSAVKQFFFPVMPSRH